MNIPEISINRHVFAFMLSAVIVLFGIVSYNKIGIDEYPEIDFPYITITTTLVGADVGIGEDEEYFDLNFEAFQKVRREMEHCCTPGGHSIGLADIQGLELVETEE